MFLISYIFFSLCITLFFYKQLTPFWGLMLGLLSKFMFSRLNVAQEFLSNFQNFEQFLATLLLLLVSALITIVHNQVVSKTVVEKFSFSDLKIANVKFFTQNPTKIFAVVFLKLEVASKFRPFRTFRPFLTLGPQQLCCLFKKRVIFSGKTLFK